MYFYVVIVQNNETQTIHRYNSYNDALAAYHAELAYRAEGRTSTKCAILDNDLSLITQEVYNGESEGE